MNKDKISKVVDKVYPQIVKKLGGKQAKIKLHHDIYERLGAINNEEFSENPSAEYNYSDKTIYLYYSAIDSTEEIIKSLLHEHTHSMQSKKLFKLIYECGHVYSTHPYEKQAKKAELKWKEYENK
jgi:hypothetical protein|tara:strand:- start:90 stop:464 length:375 start_codon:yes stop_codon:yes gene_type:complete